MHLEQARRFLSMSVAAALAAGLSGCLGCSGEGSADDEPAAALRRSFPAEADQVLQVEEMFVATERGFSVGAVSDEGAWRAPSVVLPLDGRDAIRFRDLSGVEVRVREVGALGEGAPSERSVAYKRAGGTSFWTPHPRGVEEWLHLEAAAVRAGEPVAVWEVEGATVRENGEAIELVDEGGVVRVTVTAPKAYAKGGREIAAKLSGSVAKIELSVVADAEEVLVDPVWLSAGSMSSARLSSTATLLLDGKVLVVGGSNGANEPVMTVDLYDPATNTWSAAAPITTPRIVHAAARLPDGKVLVAGGFLGVFYASADVYDPVTDTWSAVAPMGTARRSHTATLLPSGKVLVAGGAGANPEVYDPAANTWLPTGPMSIFHERHTATLLPSGQVLVAAGSDFFFIHAISELYDPAMNTWTAVGSMNVGRALHTAALLPSGKVLVVGGSNMGPLATAELFDPSTNTWAFAAPMGTPAMLHVMTLLPIGQVLLMAGTTARLYDPAMNTWSATAPMTFDHLQATATLLPNNLVMLAGGTTPMAELYASLPLGSACGQNAACVSNLCVDGVCCDTACAGGAGDCLACSVAAGAAVNGTCGLRSAGTICRVASAACDIPESCNGSDTACPADAVAAVDTQCRGAAGDCDVAESCDGILIDCPANAVEAVGTQCRAAAGDCDVAESCDGSATKCPPDAPAKDGAVCPAGTCVGGTCTESGAGGSSSSSSSSGGSVPDPGDEGACACELPGAGSTPGQGERAPAALLLALFAGAVAGRRRAARP
jgi:hypothetical protein